MIQPDLYRPFVKISSAVRLAGLSTKTSPSSFSTTKDFENAAH